LNVMLLHWVDAHTGEIGRKKLPRTGLTAFFAPLRLVRIAMDALRQRAPLGAGTGQPGSPGEVAAAQAAQALRTQQHVLAHPPVPLYLHDAAKQAEQRPAGLIIGYAQLKPQQIDRGVRRLAAAIDQLPALPVANARS
jgi:hypothetical protein